MDTPVIKRYSYEVCTVQCTTWGFRRAVRGNCALLEYHSASSGYFDLLCNKPEERSFQVSTNLWVHRFACWLLTDRNGTAIILHKVHSVNKIIEITEIIRYQGIEYRHEEVGFTKETILGLCSKLCKSIGKDTFLGFYSLSVWVCLLSLGLYWFREWHKRGTRMLPKDMLKNCGWSVNTFFCVHLVITKRHSTVVGWNPVM